MKSFSTLLLSGVLAAAPLLVSADDIVLKGARVDATFVDPEKFTDFNTDGFGLPSDRELKYLTEYFADHLEDRAKRLLGEGERLEIIFTDIDLAGRFEPERGPNVQNVRFYRDITYPRMTFSFRHLGADGQVLAEGEKKLTDLNYNWRLRLPGGDEQLRPDRDLLSDWMNDQFRQPRK